ncbi:2-phospho-L-lactate guanylyltransferase [Halorubrum sp. CBA1125]|uniref:2-phospho-L-lactate guanylyltransferase n=1 Tax=Halorubrum sp. CBA1125 TaxID=2668072 RepID=UPI0012E85BAF|nr:2-phospho-L-lactate guanylyltransferase [Halorubrum sp. CBA1125]MUW15232.1 2-phospho-L-lactate guanylyltransferase [Halorubrum sp. CBA1125]
MEVLVPFSTDRPKSRLSGVLTPAERSSFAHVMLRDVLEAVDAAGGEPQVLATGDVDVDAPVTVDERPLTTAVNAALTRHFGGDARDVDADASPEDARDVDLPSKDEGDANAPDRPEPVAVVMADLALATPDATERLFEAGTAAEVAVAPGRGGGTNALVVSHPSFRVDYHGASYLDHRRIAAEIGASLRVVDSHRLATDIDEPADLAEVLLHGDGAAADWLEEGWPEPYPTSLSLKGP